MRPLPRRASCPVRPWLRARARAVNAVSESALWGHLSAGPPQGPARRLHFSHVLVFSDPRLATPGGCWPEKGGSKSTGGLRCPRGQEGRVCGCAEHGILRPGSPGSGWAVTAGWEGRSPGAGLLVASGCCVQPLGFGVTGRARRGPAWSSPLWHSALSEQIVRCPVPLRGADICASERPGAR